MRVAYKGLIVVSVPLLFQLVLVWHLSQLINESRREFETELRARNSITLANEFMNQLVTCSLASLTLAYSGDRKARTTFERIANRIDAMLPQLQALTQDPLQRARVNSIATDLRRLLKLTLSGALQTAFMSGSGEEVTELANNVGRDLKMFTLSEEQRARQSVVTRREIRQRLHYTLVGGLILDVLLSFLLLRVFTNSIAKRLESARESIQQLAKHEVPTSQLSTKSHCWTNPYTNLPQRSKMRYKANQIL